MGRGNDAATLRVGVIAKVVPILRDLGVDVDAALRSVGLNASVFEDPETLITYAAYDKLLEIGVRESGCSHLGLLVGMPTPDLGLPGFLMLNAPTVRAGLMDAIDFHSHIDDGGVFGLNEHSGVATISYSVIASNMRCVDHLCDTAIAMAYGALRRLIGPDFQTIEIRLPRRAPEDTGPYRAFFSRGRIKFDAHHAAIDFNASHLAASVERADPTLYRLLKHLISQGPSVDISMASKIRRVLPNLILHEEVNNRVVAQMFGMHPRTMARRLAEESVTLHDLVDEARFEVAQQLLRATNLTLTEVAVSLYYSDASAFTRAFRRKFGVAPGMWRRGDGPASIAAAQ